MTIPLLVTASLLALVDPYRSSAPVPDVPKVPVAATVPDLRMESGDSSLHRARGILYCDALPFSGYLVERYPGSVVRSVTPYVQGREEGTARGWYPDGTPMYEREFVGGKREGTHRGWWSDGRLRFEYNFRNDLHQGTAREWYESGARFSEFNYDCGQEQGAQRTWDEDGRVRANYVVKDGRRYGLIGSKPCSNPLD